jgi:16S rRNA (guanine527-N7)-methyltransferase
MNAVGSVDWLHGLRRDAGLLGITVTPPQAEALAVHAGELLHWNRRVNLTAITDPGQLAIKHCVDALVAAAHLPRRASVLDIGSGGGFPGIPLKILRPDTDLLLIDAQRKKVHFLEHVIRRLGLKAIAARHVRAEALVREPDARFDVVVSRALTALPALAKLAWPLLRPDGRLMAWSGPGGQAASAALQAVIGTPPATGTQAPMQVRVYPYALPRAMGRRCLVVVRRPTGPQDGGAAAAGSVEVLDDRVGQ